MMFFYRFWLTALLSGFIPLVADLTVAHCAESAVSPANILMIAGPRSHNFGAHEHYAGLRILEDAIASSSPAANVTVVKGWPSDEQIASADSIVIFCDGGRRHVAMDHRDQLRKKLADGCGFVCLHYAVEMVPGEPGDDWVEFLGGHFEINYSVNPHWDADFKSLPDHPIANGVQPFVTNDEWYFYMRFADEGKITPILAAVAPESTMSRRDGPHSGNPHVRKSVAAGEKQTVAWAYERPGGGRSFGFTGGHYHWNWGNDNVRRLVTNAILWTAGQPIGPNGASLGQQKINMDRLLENQDYDVPKKFDKEQIKKKFGLTSVRPDKQPKAIFLSGKVTSATKRHRVEVDANI